MALNPVQIKTRETRKIAHTGITNELAEAINRGIGFGATGAAETSSTRSIVMYAEISSVYKSRAGYYNAKSIRNPPGLNDKDRSDVVESDLGTVASDDDLILVNPTEVNVPKVLTADSIVAFELIGETKAGKGFGRIIGGGSESMFPCIVEWQGGADGTSSAYATYTYNVYALSDTGFLNPLAEAVQPTCGRCRNIMASVDPAGDGSIAFAFVKTDGTVGLMDCQETYNQSNC
jgi:hypothetical protein